MRGGKKFNIVYVNQLDERGGAANVARSLMEEAKKNGHRVSMFVGKKLSNDPDIHPIQKPLAVSKLIKKATGRDIERFLKEKLNKIFPTDIDFSNVRNLFASEEYERADIVHCHNLHAGFFNLGALKKISEKKALVWTLHDMWAVTYGTPHTYDDKVENGFFELKVDKKHPYSNDLKKNKKYLRNKKRRIYEKSDFHLVVPSKWLLDKVKKSVLAEKPIHLIHNGIDNHIFKRYDKRESRALLRLPANKKILMFAAEGGEENEVKGWRHVREVISSFSGNPNVLFLSVGGKADKAENHEMIGFVPYIRDRNILARYYSASDAFVFASMAENFPLVVLEAMASGLPVVSFDVGGVKEAVLHKENGYIAEYCNPADLARGVNFIFGLPASALEKMSADSVKRVNDCFSLEAMAKKYMALYGNIIGEKFGKRHARKNLR